MKKTLYYAPRILSVLYCLFILMFSFDVFESGTLAQQLIGFIMHNIPVFILAIVSYFAWKNELIGMIGFGSMTVFMGLLVYSNMSQAPDTSVLAPMAIIMAPALLISILYGFVLWHKKRNA